MTRAFIVIFCICICCRDESRAQGSFPLQLAETFESEVLVTQNDQELSSALRLEADSKPIDPDTALQESGVYGQSVIASSTPEPVSEPLFTPSNTAAPVSAPTQIVTEYSPSSEMLALTGFDIDRIMSLDPPPVEAEIQWMLLRPSLGGANLAFSVPSGTGGNEVLLGPTDKLIESFTSAFSLDAFVPLGDDGTSLGFSGYTLSVQSKADRTLSSQGLPATLTASHSLTISSAQGIEYLFPLHNHFGNSIPAGPKNSSRLSPAPKLNLGIGAAYASVNQAYSATLASGQNAATLSSSQEFKGPGITASLYWQGRLTEREQTAFQPFVDARFTLLTGTNLRTSSFVSNPTSGNPPSNQAPITLVDNKTKNIPFGDFEAGSVIYSTAMKNYTETQVKIRVAAVCQIWGGFGLISAADTSSNRFEDGELFLYGLTLSLEVSP